VAGLFSRILWVASKCRNFDKYLFIAGIDFRERLSIAAGLYIHKAKVHKYENKVFSFIKVFFVDFSFVS